MRLSLLCVAVGLSVLQAACPPFFMFDDDIGDDDDVCGGAGCWGDGDGDTDADMDADADADADADGDGDVDTSWEMADLDVLCDTMAGAYCQGDSSCCSGGWTEEEVASCWFASFDFCREIYADAVGGGRLSIEVESISACFDAVRENITAHCPDSGPGDVPGNAACGQVLTGNVPEWGFCTSQYECQAGLSCLVEGPWAVSGICGRAPAEGEACTFVCAAGLSCLEGYCEPPHGLRSRCTVSADGTSDDCAEGLYCTADGVCGGRGSEGATCDSGRACFSEQCVEGVCASDATYNYCWGAE